MATKMTQLSRRTCPSTLRDSFYFRTLQNIREQPVHFSSARPHTTNRMQQPLLYERKKRLSNIIRRACPSPETIMPLQHLRKYAFPVVKACRRQARTRAYRSSPPFLEVLDALEPRCHPRSRKREYASERPYVGALQVGANGG
jgi:hypothetical protein